MTADTAPVVPIEPVVTPQAAPIQPAPTIVVPDIPPAVEAAPAPQPVASPTVATPAARSAAATSPRRAVTAPVAPTERTAPVQASEPAATHVTEAPVAASVAALPEPAASEAATPATAARSTDTTDTMALIALALGLLAVVGLAIWGFIAIGRRRRPDEQAALIDTPVTPERKLTSVAAEPVAPAQPFAEPAIVAPAAASVAHSGASVPLPRKLPESFEERDALLKRMIDAKPDRANPFTNRAARLRRARLILQSLGRDFGDTKPWIDLSQYPGNWPELSQTRYAA